MYKKIIGFCLYFIKTCYFCNCECFKNFFFVLMMFAFSVKKWKIVTFLYVLHSTTFKLTSQAKSGGNQTNPRMEPSFKNFELFLLFGWPGGGVSVNMVYVTFLMFTNVYIYYFWLVSFSSFYIFSCVMLCILSTSF